MASRSMTPKPGWSASELSEAALRFDGPPLSTELLERLREIGVEGGPRAVSGAIPFPCDYAPEEIAARFGAASTPFFLDSAGGARYSYLGFEPWCTLRAAAGTARVTTADGELRINGPLAGLRAVLIAVRTPRPRAEMPPFSGGAIGFLSYDLGRYLETLPTRAIDDLGTDDIFLAFYDWALAFDHETGGYSLVATARNPDREPLEAILARGGERVRSWLQKTSPTTPPRRRRKTGVRSTFTRERYFSAVQRALDHIRAGDIYQVNLSQRFALGATEHPLTIYERLRASTRANFSVYLATPRDTILSASPERFLQVRGRNVITTPIKGTRRRGENDEADGALARELLDSAKERAELAMIVDLERNDLGRVCLPGTVEVLEHATLYTLPTVHHTASTVRGTLRDEVDVAALIRAAFPGGSITGAPKIRAMEIIESLEPTRRGIYTGAIGWFGYGGDLELNIAIRTVILHEGTAFVQAGGAIVADSDPLAEYEETLTKARALLAALGAEEESL